MGINTAPYSRDAGLRMPNGLFRLRLQDTVSEVFKKSCTILIPSVKLDRFIKRHFLIKHRFPT